MKKMFSFSSSDIHKNLDKESQLVNFRKSAQLTADYICEYLRNVTRRPTFPDVMPGYLRKLIPKHAPQEPEPYQAILDDYHNFIIPGTLHWQHPDMYAYFPAGNSLCNVLAEMLSTACGGVGFSWTSQPALTELENLMMDWTARAFGLPTHFCFEATRGKGGGCLHGTASEAIFSAVISARHYALEKLGCYPQQGERKQHPGVPLQKLVCYTSCETHSSTQKAANLALTPIRILTPNDKFQITGKILEEAIKKDIEAGLIPYLVVASIGTTGGVCFDELQTIGPIAKKYDMWMHVDGAYGGNAFILPELQHLKWGMEFVDSIEINPYKMINSGLEISCLFLRDVEQYKKPWVIEATYLIDESENETDYMLKTNTIDYRHYGVALSRKMRALKLWFLFRTYGLSGLRERVRHMIKMAKYLEKLVRADDRFEVTNFVELGVVCFSQRENAESRRADASRPADAEGPSFREKQNMNLLLRINKSKKIHTCPTTLKGVYCCRISVNYPYQTEKDILRAWTLIQSLYVTTLDKEMDDVLGESTEKHEKLPSSSFLRPISDKIKRQPSLPLTWGPINVRKGQRH